MVTKDNGGVAVAASSIVKANVKSEPRKVRYKEITVRAKRNFTVLPKQVQNETRTRVGAFALPDELSAYRCLSDKEVKEYGGKLIGIIPGEVGYAKVSNEFFNNFGIYIPYDEGFPIKVPIDVKTGEIVLDYDRRNHVSAIMQYRHVTHHTRVAKDFAQYQEATHLYVAYIEDRSVIKKGNIGNKELRHFCLPLA